MSVRRLARASVATVAPAVAPVVAFAAGGCRQARAGPPHAGPPRDGDIIFQTSLSSQSLAIHKATRSKYSHMGIIFLRGGHPFVLEAVVDVRFAPLGEWIARGQGQRYVIKRLRGADERQTPEAVEEMRWVAERFLGKPYDLYFEWSDDRLYCSDPVVRAKIRERYGDAPSLGEVVIAPSAMYEAEGLHTVESR